MDSASTNQPEPPAETRSSDESPQGFVAHVGVSETVVVELSPPADAPVAEPTYPASQVREIAFQAAGAATGVVMRLYPDLVFPSDEVARAVEGVMTAFQVPGWFRGSE